MESETSGPFGKEPIEIKVPIEIIDDSGTESTVIEFGRKFSIRATVEFEDTPILIQFDTQKVDLTLRAEFFIQSIGEGLDYKPLSDDKSWKARMRIYKFEVSLPERGLNIGAYRILVLVQVLGFYIPISSFLEGPIIEVY